MNKKYVFLCISFFLYDNLIIASEDAKYNVYSEKELAMPESFFDQMCMFGSIVDRLKNAYVWFGAKQESGTKDGISGSRDIVGDPKLPLGSALLENGKDYSDLPNINNVDKKSLNKLNSIFNYFQNIDIYSISPKQQYIVLGVSCFITAVIVYKYCHSSSNKYLLRKKIAIKKIVESVLTNQSISKDDRLNKIFEILLRQGLKNIVVYNDHMFEVDDVYTFKVDFEGNKVRVTNS